MRLRGVGLSVLFAIAAVGSADAQYAATQDSSLRGLQRVYVNFQNAGAITAQQQAQAIEFVTLELRKAGVRIVPSAGELDLSKDGLFDIGFIRVNRALSTDLVLRIDIEQAATLSRTGASLQMVTWFYEDDRRNIQPDQVLQPMLRQAVDRFLNAWLSSNGR